MVNINGIPVYNALVDGENTGILKISLVDDPAVKSNFQSFDKQREMVMYSIQDEGKRLVRGVVMRADFPIYRRDKKAGEYYVIYKAETIRQMAERYLLEGRQNDVDIMHKKGSDVEGVQMVQWFIKDSDAGVSPAGFEDIADGSLFAEFHVVNDDIWNAIKKGTYKGFSLEGVFDFEPETDAEGVEEIVEALDGAYSRLHKYLKSTNQMNKFSKIMALLGVSKVELKSATTDKGVISWGGEEDIKVEDIISIVGEDGATSPAVDGDYTLEDGRIVKIADGKVTEIVEASKEVTYASVATDKGELQWDGEGDLEAGIAVYTVGEDGERVAAADGDYTTEDGKVIKVTEGKVAEIADAKAEIAPEGEEQASKFSRIKEAFSASYDERRRKMTEAIIASGVVDFYIEDAGDDYCVTREYNAAAYSKNVRYALSFDEAGNCILGESQEVKSIFVPLDFADPFDTAKEAEELRSQVSTQGEEITALKAQIEEFKKLPAAKGLHEQYHTAESKTGSKGADKLASYFAK